MGFGAGGGGFSKASGGGGSSTITTSSPLKGDGSAGNPATLDATKAIVATSTPLKGDGSTGNAVTVDSTQAVSALSFTSSAGAGVDGIKVATNGRTHFGSGATDYASSDGTTVTFAGPIATGTGGTIVTGTNGTITIGSSGNLVLGASGSVKVGTVVVFSGPGPSVQSGFGTTGAGIIGSPTGCAYRVQIGSNATDTSGILNVGTAQTGWICHVQNITTPGTYQTRQSAFSTTQVTLTNYAVATGVPIAWNAGDVLLVTMVGF